MYNKGVVDELVHTVAANHGIGDKSALAALIQKHWAGRNSRGVTQYVGKALEDIVFAFDNKIDAEAARRFIDACLMK